MKLRAFLPKRGAVALVALTCVTVLGLTVTAYFAQSNQSTRLSNRTYAQGVSVQLAEAGVETALRAITTNDFSDLTVGTAPNQTVVDWTLSGTTATATLTLPAAKYGATGMTGSAKIRVDNHNAYNLPAAWSATVSYRLNDVVGSAGLWYRCVLAHTNQTPANNLTFWVPAPIPWTWSGDIAYVRSRLVNYRGTWYRYIFADGVWVSSRSYALDDVVQNSAGTWYRCILAHTSSALFLTDLTALRWTILQNYAVWAASRLYPLNAVVQDSAGSWFRCISLHTSSAAFSSDSARWVSFQNQQPMPDLWAASTLYAVNNVIRDSAGTWYRCVMAHTSSAAFATDAARWVSFQSSWVTVPTSVDWAASTLYAVNDVIRDSSGALFRCVTAHTSSAAFATDAARWTSSVTAISTSWTSGTVYSRGSLVFTNGLWYYCVTAHTGATFATDLAANLWARLVANPPTTTWSNLVAYRIGDYVYSTTGSAWYRCIVAHTNFAVTDPAYWATTDRLPSIFWAWQSTASYAYNDLVFSSASGAGTWYRCILGHSNFSPPTNATYWENALSVSWAWDSADNYNIGDVVYSGTSFYRCIVAHKDRAPPNAAFWSPSPLLSNAWDPGRLYGSNDTVFYNGYWYLSLQSSNAGNNPTATEDWDATKTYVSGNLVNRSSTLYRCIATNLNQVPPNATFWTSTTNRAWAIAPRAIAAWSATVSYSIDDLVSSGGVWYRCVANHLNQAVSATAFWAPISGASNQWSAATAYAVNTYVNYGGAWYRCILDHTNQTPNNSTYWTASWAQSSGVTTGAPVIYAEGSAVLPGAGATTFTTLKTQFRALVAPAPLFPNAVAATDTVTIGGAGTVDSYDGSASGVGVGGINTTFTYNQTSSPFTASAPNLGAAATIASTSTASTAIAGGTGTIQGYLAAPSATTAPYAPTSSFNGILRGGSTGTGIDLTRLSRSPFVPQPQILPAIQHTWLPGPNAPPDYPSWPATINLGTPGSPIPSSYYYNASVTLSSTWPTTLNINGPVILFLNGDLRVNTGGVIRINSTGSLVVYSTARLRVESGGNGIVNRNPTTADPDPKNLVILGDTISTATQYINYAGASFSGVVYLPNTTTANGLRIASGVTIVGALSAKEITFSGAANVRYDTSLRYARIPGVEQIYQTTELRELTNPAERIVLP